MYNPFSFNTFCVKFFFPYSNKMDNFRLPNKLISLKFSQNYLSVTEITSFSCFMVYQEKYLTQKN